MKLLSIIILLAVTFSCNSQDPILKLEGIWKVDGKEQFESWKLTNDTLKGEGYKIKNGEKVIFEYLTIYQSSDQWIYTATVPDQNEGQSILFILNPKITGKLSFENLNHDFPKKIQYQFVQENQLFVQVLGANDEGFSLTLNRQPQETN